MVQLEVLSLNINIILEMSLSNNIEPHKVNYNQIIKDFFTIITNKL